MQLDFVMPETNIGTFFCLASLSDSLSLFTPPLSMYLAGSVSLAITRYMEGRKAGYCQKLMEVEKMNQGRGENILDHVSLKNNLKI